MYILWCPLDHHSVVKNPTKSKGASKEKHNLSLSVRDYSTKAFLKISGDYFKNAMR